jgi:hypothetical protein
MATKKRIFIAFAMEDERYRNLLRGHSFHTRSPIEFTDFSVKKPFDRAWKTHVRERIRSCRGVIALLSNNVRNADGARWEINCAIEEGKPIRGLYIGEDRYVPPELKGKRCMRWTWPGVASFIDNL